MAADPPPVYTLWEQVTADLFARTERFPKSVRQTLTHRIENLALDVLEGIVEARYAPAARKSELLRLIDERLTRLRCVLRIALLRRCLDPGAHEHVMRRVDEAGRMLGGWRRQAGSAGPAR